MSNISVLIGRWNSATAPALLLRAGVVGCGFDGAIGGAAELEEAILCGALGITGTEGCCAIGAPRVTGVVVPVETPVGAEVEPPSADTTCRFAGGDETP